jgi:hypothetical protein
MTSRWLAGITLATATVAGASPDQAAPGCGKPCRQHPQIVGACFTFRGRMSSWNGAPSVRIWRVGTKRILGVSEQRFRLDGYCNLPRDLAGKLSWDTDLFGEFTVCPFTQEKPGAMRMVCVESGANLEVRPREP